jgi:ribosomal protein S18 acetylase RimI-like enzyme
VTVRPLERRDGAAYRALRLRALREHPEAFVAVYENEAALPMEHFADRIAPSACSRVFGGFVGDVLSGIIGISRQVAPKLRHRANIWGMYVAPEARGRGVGRALLDTALDTARAWEGAELVTLSVSEASGPACALYVGAGFVRWGVLEDAVRVAGRSYHEEYLVLTLPL